MDFTIKLISGDGESIEIDSNDRIVSYSRKIDD